MIALTRSQVRSLDRIAQERFRIPGLILMENAGRGAADFLRRRFGGRRFDPVMVVAGRGNNGGDGFVIARHLAIRGRAVEILLLGEPGEFRGPGDAGVNFTIVERMGLPIHSAPGAEGLADLASRAGLLVDALLGTGLTGEVRGPYALAIAALNEAAAPIFAVDVPSGLDCDTGLPLGLAVRAATTATFAAMKVGLLVAAAREFTGAVEVVSIGCPPVWE